MINFINAERGITQEDIKALENEFSITLPESYKVHALKFNGGKPSLEMFEGLRVHYFHSIKYGEFDTLEETLRTIEDVLPSNFFPFAEDGGGNQIGFFLDGANEGKVYIWYHDMGEEDDLEFLANSFDEFLAGLSDDEDY